MDYRQSGDIFTDASAIIDTAQTAAYRAVNAALVHRNWLLGRRIADECLHGENRAEYGKQVIADLVARLTARYGKGFDFSTLYKFLAFYRAFPILDSLSPKSGGSLSWTHYRILLQVTNDAARRWYMDETASEAWSVRTLQRNISSQYYERTLLSQHKEAVKSEMVRLTSPLQDKLEFIKNPVIAEFLGLSPRTDFTESDLETRILDNIGKFLMELGVGNWELGIGSWELRFRSARVREGRGIRCATKEVLLRNKTCSVAQQILPRCATKCSMVRTAVTIDPKDRKGKRIDECSKI